jgi:hypothetical protein
VVLLLPVAAFCCWALLERSWQCWAFSGCLSLITAISHYVHNSHQLPADWDVSDLIGGSSSSSRPAGAAAQAAMRQLAALQQQQLQQSPAAEAAAAGAAAVVSKPPSSGSRERSPDK